MKSLNRIFFILLSIGLVFTACKKDEDPTPDEDQKPVVYTVEQNKANMETEGIEMVNDARELKNSEAISVSNYLVSLMELNAPINMNKSTSKNGAIRMLYALKQFSQNGNVNGIYGNMKSISQEPSGPQQVFDSIKGKYTWNPNTETWTKEENSAFILVFPSSANSLTNDASFTVNYVANNDAKPFTNYQGDIPASITATLKRNNNTLIGFNFSAVYDVKGLPSELAITLDVLQFRLAYTFNHSNTALGFNYSFKKGTKIIFDAGASAVGNFSYENIESLSKDTTNPIQNVEDITKVATSFNSHFQLMRYRINGSINLQGLSDDLVAAGGSQNITQDQGVTIINKNYSLSVIDTENMDALVAGTEFYVLNEDMNMRFVFPDGSKVDMDAFAKNGFEDFITEVNNFGEELKTEFGK